MYILQVLNVVYTNDGLSDTITLYIDGQNVGSFDTKAQSNHGHLWNEPVSSGPIGEEVYLSSGDHTVKLTVTKMGKYGIEIDRTILGLICTNDVSNSDGICPKSQEPDIIIPNNDSWSKADIMGVIVVCAGCTSTTITLIALITNCYYHRKGLGSSEPQESIRLLLPQSQPQPQPLASLTVNEHIVNSKDE
jgi:hypothetical protein